MPVRKLVNPRRKKKNSLRGRRRDARGRLLKMRARNPRKRTYKLRARKAVKRPRKLKANRRRAGNPSLVLMGLNPVRSGGHMKKKKKNAARRHHYRIKARRHNPAGVRRHYRVRRRRSTVHNPFGMTWPKLFEQAFEVLIGGFGARLIPQYALPNQNQGIAGYGLNAITTALLAALGEWVRKGSGAPVAFGGILMTVSRIVSDKWGKTLVTFGLVDQSTGLPSGTAAITAPAATTTQLSAGDLAFDLRGYKATYFPLPTVSDKGAMTTTAPWSSDLANLQAAIAALQTKGKGGGGFAPGKMPAPTSTSSKKGMGRFGPIM